MWRIKLYPKGNGTSYLGAYIECVDFVTPEETGSQVHMKEKIKAPMPVVGGSSMIEMPQRIPVQMSIMIYNPQEPRVHFHKRASHGFTPKDPDRGFSRFGPTPFFDLGRRLPDTRQALLRDDKLAFVAHVRIVNDPTGFLFAHEDTNHRDDFFKTGLRPLKTTEDRRGPANNLSAAVASWVLLAPFRRIIYGASQIMDGKPRPLVSAFEELLFEVRRPIDETTQPSGSQTSPQVSLDRIAEAIQWWGVGRGHETCRDWVRYRATLEKRDKVAFQHTNKETRLAWHPFHEPLHDCDVIQVFEILLDGLEEELRDTSFGGTFLNLFTKEGFRCKLPAESSSIRGGLMGRLSAAPKESFPPILQVEIPRQKFNENSRKWEKVDDRITISEMVKMTQEQPGMYTLYGLITHDWGLNSRAYSPIIRPDGRSWYKFSTDRFAKAEKITSKQALSSNETRVYIAIYVRNDLMESDVDPHSPRFVGFPEDRYKTSEAFLHRHDPPTEKPRIQHTPGIPTGSGEGQAQNQSQPPQTPQTPEHPPEATEQKNETEAEDASKTIDGTHDVHAAQTVAGTDQKTLDDREWDRHHSEAICTIDYFSRAFFRGTMHKGHMHGQGQCIYMSGDTYQGKFRKGLRHGTGTQTFQNGDIYEGEWVEDKMHGTGKLVNALTGNTYVGGFREGNQYGNFTLSGKKAEALKLCLVCYVQERDAVFYPCGHVCACLDCAREIEDCPYCHKHIAEPIRFYLS